MGCVSGKDCQKNEKPVHKVTVDSFYIAKYETTVGQFKAFVRDTGYKTLNGCTSASAKSWLDLGFGKLIPIQLFVWIEKMQQHMPNG